MYYYTYGGNLKDRNKYTSTANTSFGTKRYFSSLDTEVYFGSKQIDEMFSIDFVISEPKLPIYGYNSFYANRMIAGRRTIQGTFAINFTHTNNMLKILREIDDSILASEYEAIVRRCEGEDSTGLGIGNSSVFDKIFDITISYGYGKTEGMQTYNSCYQTLVGVQIVEYRQALDTEGNPILDMYSFIAKDIRYNNESTGGENTGTEENTQEETISYIVANRLATNEYNELVTKTTNTEVDGFAITPLFNYVGEQFYISFKIEAVNNQTKTFKDISITVVDQPNTINSSYSVNTLNNNTDAIFSLEGSSRTVANTLYKNYSQDSNYLPDLTVEFTATVDGKETPIKYQTKLWRK